MRIASAFAAAALAWVIAVTIAIHAAGTTERVPVVVELFTSEGCSDCPPADNVLAKLAAQPVPGVEIIALGEHVDYWDKQGWKDPFSSSTFTARQVDYTRALHVDSPYTPQMIVNGRDEFVGSNYAAAANAITKAARDKQALSVSIIVEKAAAPDGLVSVTVDAPGGAAPHPAEMFVALTEDGLSSKVERGENRGKTLSHAAVVRWLSTPVMWDAKMRAGAVHVGLRLEPQWQLKNMRAVVFLQDHSSREIVGAASAPLR